MKNLIFDSKLPARYFSARNFFPHQVSFGVKIAWLGRGAPLSLERPARRRLIKIGPGFYQTDQHKEKFFIEILKMIKIRSLKK